MISTERLTVLVLFVSLGVNGSVIVKRENEGSGNRTNGFAPEKSFSGGTEEVNLEREILQEINHLNPRKQREIFDDLEKQNKKFNISQKSLVLAETENLSPLNVEELKTIRKTIKAKNGSLPAIRNKRTLSFLLRALVRAMGYTLTPSNPDAEWIPRQQPPPAQPCSTPAPPCNPNPPSTPPPCPPPPCSPNPPSTPPPCPPPPCSPNPPSTPPPCPPPSSTPPCTGSNALILAPTIPPSQVDPNTISYPYRPSRTIPLFNFAPLPAGLRVPYPPLLQPPAQQRASCPPQQPSPSPCAPPASTPAPCQPSPPPCTTPAPSPPPCTTPAPSPPPCQPTTAPPCGKTPPTKQPPCQPSPPSTPPPCQPSPPPPKTPPCQTTPAPPPPCTTPAPSQPPCTPPNPPPCATPAPPPPPPPSDPPKKGSILLEYDDPVRIQIFSNDKKYLPASGNIFSGADEENRQDWHSYFYPENEKSRKKDEDYEEKEEMEEEHIEEEEDEEAPGQLKHYEEEDERTLAEEEDESETSLSIVKKPIVEKDGQKIQKQRMVSKTNGKEKKTEKEEAKEAEKSKKIKKPKRKKWIRIVKKQRRKSKTDSNPDNSNNFQIYSSDSISEASEVSPRYYEKRNSRFAFDSYERDFSDFSSPDERDDSSSRSTEVLDLKKVIVNNRQIKSPGQSREEKAYEFNFNPFAPEPEEERRRKLEKAVEKYVEDYVEQQLGNELIKNTGVPKTTVFEFTPKNGPKIQTITTTVAKTSGNPRNFRPKNHSETRSPTGNSQIPRKSGYEENSKKRGNVSYEEFVSRT